MKKAKKAWCKTYRQFIDKIQKAADKKSNALALLLWVASVVERVLLYGTES